MTLNDTLNAVFSARDNAVAKAQQERDAMVAQADETLAELQRVAEETFEKKLSQSANAHFKKGGTLEDFAKAYGKSVPTTRNHLKELGVVVPQGKRGVKSKYSAKEQKEIAKAWHSADTRGRLSLALDKDVTEATMRNWAIEHGVYEPKKREAKAEAEVQETVNA